ncbi:uncharacterized protein T551_01262 [Pneumocystis jirovecii RU7]|uniref:Mitochondrial outer membrane protein porin n=1 Tax=Pneumocystis jirovecii (strain RU7) TaxID=1408657 RepID=A0A0W4ZS75_PNEJ7|nr:uncharacterized protein T551_01262 [Pneumocystis jirovecii RU7]KTW31189.1 hypothetical protein T551_01262 [Pneumocystis jirovecii RU7]
MISVPSYDDFAKQQNDIFSKDFPIDGASLDIRTKAPNGVEFSVKGNQTSKIGSILGQLEGKYSDKLSGFSFLQNWTTNNALATKIELQDHLAKGLSADINTTLFLSSNTKNAKLGLGYKQPTVNVRTTIDLFKGPTFLGNIVVGKDGFLAGGNISYDILNGSITDYAASIGCIQPQYSIAVQATQNLSVFSASYYHRVNSLTEVAGRMTWDTKKPSSMIALEVGTKHFLDKDVFVKAKINNDGIAGLSYTQTLYSGIKVGLGLSLDTQRLSEAAHKIGMSITIQS